VTTSDTTSGLDPCGCCEAGVPVPELFNRPGLPALAYRIGTHPAFLRRMLARLPATTITDGPNAGARPLARLSTRASDDPSIALLDAWATVADVLTFYQERIANEGYLRTATERRSVLELARTIGYELNPGVAAGTFLAFTVESAPGSPGVAAVPPGTKVQSIPGPNQLPQTFETIEALDARAEWNTLAPQRTVAPVIARGTTELHLAGVSTGLQPGDAILLVGDERSVDSTESERWDFRIVQTVTLHPDAQDPARSHTVVTWLKGLGDSTPPPTDPAASNIQVYAFRQRASLFGHNAPDFRAMALSVKQSFSPKLNPLTPVFWPTEWPSFSLHVVKPFTIDLDAAYPKILVDSWVVLRTTWATELYRATRVSLDARTDFTLTSKTTRIVLDTGQYLGQFGLRTTAVYAQSEPLAMAARPLADPVSGNQIALDALVDGLGPGRLLLVSGKRPRVTIVGDSKPSLVAPDGRTVAVSPGDSLQVVAAPALGPRASVVWTLMDRDGLVGNLTLASAQLLVPAIGAKTPLTGTTVTVAPGVSGLFFVPESGSSRRALATGERLVVVEPPTVDSAGRTRWRLRAGAAVGIVTVEPTGLGLQPADDDDETVTEAAIVKTASADRERTTLTLEKFLVNSYERASTRINANVARATHGETVKDEVLGGGDGARANPQFALRKPPLTFVSAATPSGALSTLAVRVDGVRWLEVASLFAAGGLSQVYVVRIDDDGKTRVVFGDGERGARLPTGTENVVATYRSGIGLAGLVESGSLTLLQTRPLGVRGVTNPMAATGAAAPEALQDARTNAPLTVLTLDRIVSLKDYADFARAFAGIGKATAVALWNGERRLVHVVVAGATGQEVASSSDLYVNLVKAIDAQRDPGQLVQVASFKRRTFSLTASLLIDPRRVAADVLAAATSRLLQAFSFQARDFGQPVTAAEVITVIQAVTGVVAVDLDALTADGATAGASTPPAVLPAHLARLPGEVTELLMLEAAGIHLSEMTP
jgi:hypothetical protein